MPRKPYLPAYASCRYAIGISQINERPKFVEAIGRCITSWSFVEHHLALLFGVILKAENDAAVAVFSALRRRGNQRDAINTAARHSLDDKTRRLLGGVLAAMQSVEKERNSLVHGQWGIFPDREDIVAWIPSDRHATWNTKVLTSEDKGIHLDHEGLKKALYVYNMQDIDDIFFQINEAWAILFDFTVYVRRSKSKGMFGLTGEQLYDHLCQIPRIRDALARLDRPQNAPVDEQ